MASLEGENKTAFHKVSLFYLVLLYSVQGIGFSSLKNKGRVTNIGRALL